MNALLCLLVTGIALAVVRGTHGKTYWEGPWYNNSSPSLHNGSETEMHTAAELKSICQDGSPVIDAHCRDEKGEPFRVFKNDTANKYVATCTVMTGLQCNPYNNTIGAYCADYAIQYGCNCPATPAVTGVLTTPKGIISGSEGTSDLGGSEAVGSTLETGSGNGSSGSRLNCGGIGLKRRACRNGSDRYRQSILLTLLLPLLKFML